jgi:hypothetical protein
MVRNLILAVAILAMAVVPVPALARESGHGSSHAWHGSRGHEFHGHHGPFVGVGVVAPYAFYPYPYPAYAYAPRACYWQAGYSVNQPYVDAWGRYTYVQQWVPAQWVCQ